MIREERVKREKRVQIPGASACAEAYNTGVSGSCLVLSALMRFLFLVFIKSFSLFKRYCPLWVPGSPHIPSRIEEAVRNVVAPLVGNTSHLRTSCKKVRGERIKQVDKIEKLILRI